MNPGNQARWYSLGPSASVVFFVLCLLQAALGCSSDHSKSTVPPPESELSMSFQLQDFQYVSEGEIVPLELYRGWVAVRSRAGELDPLRSALESTPGVRSPLEALEAARGLWLIELEDGLGSEEILELLERLNGASGIDFASPVFQAPSSRGIVTEEIVVKFRRDASPEDITDLLSSRGLGVIKEDYPLERCYLVSFARPSGPNPLVVSTELSSHPLVEYCHPNFFEVMEAPDARKPLLEEDGFRPLSTLPLRKAGMFYPNVFQEFDWISQGLIEVPSGWQVLAGEDFEGDQILGGWTNEDRNPETGRYFWGPVDDASYPAYIASPQEAYPGEGQKGWVAARHDPSSPDLWPDSPQEAYAQNMDTWLVRTVDLSNSLWARLRFRMVFWAPSTETFGWFASPDGLNWHGTELEGKGDQRRFYCYWPFPGALWDPDPPSLKGVYFNLTSVPEIGDLSGLPNVRVGLRFQSDGSVTATPYTDLPFYGVFLDNILLEHLPANRASSITTDPLSKWQWGLHNTGQSGGTPGYDIDAVRAWDLLQSVSGIAMPADPSNPVVVAVLDTGVDLAHEDLNVLEGYDARYHAGDAYRELQDSRGGANPCDGHGTACAGIIGARNNTKGVVGVAPGVKILPIRIASTNYIDYVDGCLNVLLIFSTPAEIADGIVWAVNHGARVLSNSWGGGRPYDVIRDALREAVSAGAVVICSSGNDNRNLPGYPARYEETIAVGAMSPCGERKNPSSCDGEWWWGSNYGNAELSDASQIDVVGPGVLVATTDITGDGGYVPANPSTGKDGNYFVSFNGTSSACPFVAGVAALVLSANPYLSSQEVREILQQSAQDLGDPGRDLETGFGLVNAYRAVDLALEETLDLRPVHLSIPDPLFIGASQLIAVGLRNDAAYRAAQTTLRIYLSRNNAQIDGSDTLLLERTVTLEPGEEKTLQAQMLVPGVTPAGPAFLIAWVDPLNRVAERDETNNQLARQVQLLHPPCLSVKPSQVDFGSVEVGSTVSRTVTLQNEPVQTPAAGLTVTSLSIEGNPAFDHPDNLLPSTPYTLAPYQSSRIWLYFSPQAAGTYSGTLTVRSNDPNQPVRQIPLSATAFHTGPTLSLSDVPVDFGPWKTRASFSIGNTGSAALTWSLDLSGKPSWLVSASPSSGTTSPGGSTAVSLTANRSGLAPGMYTYDLPVNSNGGSATVRVTLTVLGLGLQVEPSAIDFGPTDDQRQLTLLNTGFLSIQWSIDPAQLPGWLGVSPTQGTLSVGASTVLTLSADRTDLAPGQYTHNLLVTSGGGTAVVPVSLEVPRASLTVEISAEPAAGQAPLTVFFTATASGGNPPYGFAWDFGDGQSGVGPAPSHVYRLPGPYLARVTVTDSEMQTASGQVSITVLPGAGWSRSFGRGGGWTDYHTYGLTATQDGGLAFCAEMMHPQRGDYDFWICKVDAAGSIEWERSLGGELSDYPSTLHRTSDGGFLAAGRSYSFRTGSSSCDAWIVKLSESGQVLWQSQYGGIGMDRIDAIEEVFDPAGRSEGYIAVGSTSSYEGSGTDVWILSLAPWGEPLWAKTVGGPGEDFGLSARRTPDGGFLVAGATRSFGAGSWDVWILKFSQEGVLEWQKTMGGPGDDVPNSIELAPEGGYVIGATTDSFGAGDKDYWMFQLDLSGVTLWEYKYGGAGHDFCERIMKTSTGNFLLVGYTDSFPTPQGEPVQHNAWILKTSASGIVEWEKIYNKPFEIEGEPIDAPDWAYNIVETSDGLYAVSGDTDGWDDDRSTDSWIFKIDPQGNLGCGIETETDSLRMTGHAIGIAEPAEIFELDLEVPGISTSADLYPLESDTFVHCPLEVHWPTDLKKK